MTAPVLINSGANRPVTSVLVKDANDRNVEREQLNRILKYLDERITTVSSSIPSLAPSVSVSANNTWTGENDFVGKVTFSRSLNLSSILTPPQITGNTDNYNPVGLTTCNVLRLSTDASRNLTGLVAFPALILLSNVGAQDLVLVHDATSTAANRFYCPGSANFTLSANDSVFIWYDIVSSRWRVLGF